MKKKAISDDGADLHKSVLAEAAPKAAGGLLHIPQRYLAPASASKELSGTFLGPKEDSSMQHFRFPNSTSFPGPVQRFQSFFLIAGLLLTTALLGSACSAPEPTSETAPESTTAAVVEVTDTVRQAAEAIDPATLTAVIKALSSDEMEGRGPASVGDRMAQAHIADELGKLGVQPGAADGTWFQPFGVVGIDASAPKTWTFSTAEKEINFKWWDEYIASSGVQDPEAVIDGSEVVFVGYGIQAPEYGWDDYKDVDVSGKVLLMLNNDPDWDQDLFAGDLRLYYGRWTYKYEIAAAMGAAGAIIIHTRPSAGYPWQVVQTSWTGPQFELPARDEPRTQVTAWLTWDAASRLASEAGQDLDTLVEAAKSQDFKPIPLGVTTSLRLENTLEQAETGNVIGVLPGSDPELADEAIVYTAHHDHLGVGLPNDDGDAIYNGARDNAAGIGQIVAIAKAFTALPEPPRRSIVFLAVGAEEQGLLGSKFYAQNPTFAPGKISANLNFDAPTIWGRTKDLPLVGLGKSDLDGLASRVAAMQGRVVTSESDPTQGSFYRSDQFNFAKIGVPALYFDEGTDFLDKSSGLDAAALEAWNLTHYHQPSDELDESWNLEGAAEDAQLGFYCGWILATQEALPSWNPGDEFEATRKEALAAVAGE